MKTVYFFTSAILLAMMCSCGKSVVKNDMTAAPVFFEIVDKSGKSMINSLKDSAVVTYTDNSNLPQKIKLTIGKLFLLPDTTRLSTKYNGLYVMDNALMSQLSFKGNAHINNFSLSLNGVNLGNIYLDYSTYLTVYPNLSSSALTFNNVPIVQDNSVLFDTGGYNLNVIQVNK